MKKVRILVVEPYFGGSHRVFLEGLMQAVPATYTTVTLPARKWKLRMQLSAHWVAEKVAEQSVAQRSYDIVLCSTFVDVAVLRALLSRLKGWNQTSRFCTYFHENQFAYPVRFNDPTIHQFTAINFSTAAASDALAFNSQYNYQSFLAGVSRYLKNATDMDLHTQCLQLENKSVILHPGLDYSRVDGSNSEQQQNAPVIVWNHRWEHDKNPQEFFTTLLQLKDQGIQFGLIILGQSFSRQPGCFARAREQFATEIIHYGYAESDATYAALLNKGDIVVSTAHHEFFGISVVEAIRAGCHPLLPNRLSYPELFPAKYLYEPGMLVAKLAEQIGKGKGLNKETALQLTEPFAWGSVASKYQDWLLG